MTATPRTGPLERFAAGDDAAATALVTETLAPTFDLAFHLCGDAERAGAATERACATFLASLRDGTYAAPEPLAATARHVVAWARSENRKPFDAPFGFDDAGVLGCTPTDRRLGALAALPAEARFALAVAVATDLADAALGHVLGVGAITAEKWHRDALDAVPSDAPSVRLRDLFDLRASAVRIPRGTEDRILAPYEGDEG